MVKLWSTKSSKLKCESFFVCFLAAAHCRASWQWIKSQAECLGTWGTTCTVSSVRSLTGYYATSFLHLCQSFEPRSIIASILPCSKEVMRKLLHGPEAQVTEGLHHWSPSQIPTCTYTLRGHFFQQICWIYLIPGHKVRFLKR